MIPVSKSTKAQCEAAWRAVALHKMHGIVLSFKALAYHTAHVPILPIPTTPHPVLDLLSFSLSHINALLPLYSIFLGASHPSFRLHLPQSVAICFRSLSISSNLSAASKTTLPTCLPCGHPASSLVSLDQRIRVISGHWDLDGSELLNFSIPRNQSNYDRLHNADAIRVLYCRVGWPVKHDRTHLSMTNLRSLLCSPMAARPHVSQTGIVIEPTPCMA